MKAAIILVAVVVAFAVQAQALEVAPHDLQKGSCQACKDDGKDWYCPSNGKCSHYHIGCAFDCHSPCETTKACDGCHSGSNCTCGQCAEDGYSYYAPIANECYKSLTTCVISVHQATDCIETSTCTPRSTCSATQASNCTGNQTCCLSSTGTAFCAPEANAVCCGYKQMTCAQNDVCDPPSGQCMPIPATPPPSCAKCQTVVQHIEEKGCSSCATAFPKLAWLCSLIQKLGLCKYLENNALSPKDVCGSIGFCGSQGCSCGYCRPQLFGQWCLSAPNRCPSGAEQPALLNALNNAEAKTFKTDAERDTHYESSIRRLVKSLQARKSAEKQTRLGNFCADGVCDSGHTGCCLTCL